ncbi:MAG TPA: thioredoxin family protein [Bacteroidales bacterium]|nr:thioredoxin family protein [Bacteroidales bacterium]HPS72911.1 thioredoxin family protein [Bacteroidales bacterium]
MNASDKRKPISAILNITFIGLGLVALVLLFVFKGSLNTVVTKTIKAQAGEELQNHVAMYVDSAFNYRQNGEGFRITFLEFGAKGCSACKMMEKEMEKVKNNHPDEVRVTFVNVLMPAGQDLMKYYGIASIPTQVLLDDAGHEVFRHTGYFSSDDLDKEFLKINP